MSGRFPIILGSPSIKQSRGADDKVFCSMTQQRRLETIPDSHTEQYRNSFFIRTASEWNQLEESHIRAETVSCP